MCKTGSLKAHFILTLVQIQHAFLSSVKMDSFSATMKSSQGNTMALQKKVDVSYKHEICEVFELAAKLHWNAQFLEVKRDGPIHDAVFTFCLTVGRLTTEAQGPTKIIAKTLAAQQILPDLRRIPLTEKMQSGSKKNKKLWRELPTFGPTANPIVCLHEIVTKLSGNPPVYTVVHVDREFKPWVLYVQLTVAEETVMGAGNSKKAAKRNAAAKVLNKFGYNFPCFEPENTKEELLVVTQVNPAPNDQNPLSKDLPDVGEGAKPAAIEQQPSSPQENAKDAIQEETVETVHVTVEPAPDASMDNTSTAESEASGSEGETYQEKPHSEDSKGSSPPEDVEMTQVTDVSTEPKVSEGQRSPVTKTIMTVVISMSSNPPAPAGEDSVPVPERSDPPTSSSGRPVSDALSNALDEKAVNNDNMPMANDEPLEQDVSAQPALDLQELWADVQPLLDFMGVETHDIMEMSQDVSSTVQTELEENKSEASPPQDVEMPTANGPAGEDSIPVPGRSAPPPSFSELPESCTFTNVHQRAETDGEDTSPVPGKSDSPTSSSGRPVSYILSNALVKKVLKMAGSHDRDSVLMAINLNETVKEQLIVELECDISFKDLEKMGKMAAKRLVLEHGSAHALLKAAAENTAAFEEDVVRHLSTELRAFLNRPKSVSARLFSRLRRTFCFS